MENQFYVSRESLLHSHERIKLLDREFAAIVGRVGKKEFFMPDGALHHTEASRGPKYACTWPGCFKRYSASDYKHAKSHWMMHHNIKPYICSYCSKPFTRKSDCKRHKKVHLNRQQCESP